MAAKKPFAALDFLWRQNEGARELIGFHGSWRYACTATGSKGVAVSASVHERSRPSRITIELPQRNDRTDRLAVAAMKVNLPPDSSSIIPLAAGVDAVVYMSKARGGKNETEINSHRFLANSHHSVRF